MSFSVDVCHAFVLDGPCRSWACATERGEEREHFLSVLRSAIKSALTGHQWRLRDDTPPGQEEVWTPLLVFFTWKRKSFLLARRCIVLQYMSTSILVTMNLYTFTTSWYCMRPLWIYMYIWIHIIPEQNTVEKTAKSFTVLWQCGIINVAHWNLVVISVLLHSKSFIA